MKRTIVVLLGAIAMPALSSPARSESPVSPWEMAVATEQWLVEGAGARVPDGMAGPASDDISTKNSSSTARLDITSQYKEP